MSINHERKTISLSDYKPINYIDFDLEETLKYCEKINVEIVKQGYLISLTLIDKIDIPFSKLTLLIDKKYWIKTVEMYYATKINFSNSYFEPDLDYPKLQIHYNEINKKWKDKQNILSLSTYLQSTRKPLKLANQFKDYQLLDLRK